jgi:pyrroloquinoline quinone biosynthesis protein A
LELEAGKLLRLTPTEDSLILCCAQKNFVVYFGAAFLIKLAHNNKLLEGIHMKWETPAYNDMRFGFEVTMYIYNR